MEISIPPLPLPCPLFDINSPKDNVNIFVFFLFSDSHRYAINSIEPFFSFPHFANFLQESFASADV